MQLVTKATLLAAVALSSIVMVMDRAAAVEVSDGTPLLPTPSYAKGRSGDSNPTGTRPSPDCFILGSRSFSIPFTVDAAGAQPVEVHLFVSRTEGGPWELLDQKRPDVAVKQFQFTALDDGEYRFATRTIDALGRSHPATAMQSQLKVYVDTTKPIVTLDVDADATGRVEAVLAINDATPLKKWQLRYATDTLPTWQNVDLRELPPDGRVQFTPAGAWKQLSLQFAATDTPGNQSVVTELLRRPRLAASTEARFAATPMNDSIDARPMPYRINSSAKVEAMAVADPVVRLDRNKPKPVPGIAKAQGYAPSSRGTETALHSFRGAATAPLPSLRSATALPPSSTQVNTAPPSGALPFAPPSVQGSTIPRDTVLIQSVPQGVTPQQAGNGFGLQSPQQNAAASPTPPSTPPRPSRARTPAEAMRPLSERSVVSEIENQPTKTAGPTQESVPTPKPEIDTGAERYKSLRPFESAISAGLTPVRYSGSERFSLEYELEAVGNRGVDAIELYGSVDGKSWELWGRDPDRRSPFDIETQEEGRFGFRIVVVGQNGLASPRPLPNETPDIVVVVDKIAPRVRITGAQYGEGDRIGALVIRYECEDANLKNRPIALSFSDDLQGPWTTIAAGLRNDGDYVWPADPQLPRQLFLRIDATDQAENVGTYILDQPIDAQGLAPRARIRGFQSLSLGEQPAPGQQTAGRPKASFK